MGLMVAAGGYVAWLFINPGQAIARIVVPPGGAVQVKQPRQPTPTPGTITTTPVTAKRTC